MMAWTDFRVQCVTAQYELLTTEECWWNKTLASIEPVFLILFVMEMVLKFVAMGLYDTPTISEIKEKGWFPAWKECDKTGYFNSGWRMECPGFHSRFL
jgi:hypothetical protein